MPKPKTDPDAELRAKQASEERVKTMQEDLQDVTTIRARRFGAAGRGLAGVAPATS